MSFLPEGYKVPRAEGQFMKFQEGKNRFRILSEAVVGWEGWKDGKPFRRKGVECNITADEVDHDTKYDRAKINHFWAFIVWNYEAKKIQVLEITQATIQRAIENYYIIDDWGDPKGYDVVVDRSKQGDKTVYTVSPVPPKPLDAKIAQAYEESDADLEKLFTGEYPMSDKIAVEPIGDPFDD